MNALAPLHSDGTQIVGSGLQDMIVVASEDAIYVGRLADAQNITTIVKSLRQSPETLPLTIRHLTSHRPWGGFSTIFTGDRYRVKRLFVKPGKSLSLQKHNHGAEHGVTVRGIAEVLIGDETRTLRENEGAYIAPGQVHRLSNPRKILLEMIEVQTGSYLGEDDIRRLKDRFGRI